MEHSNKLSLLETFGEIISEVGDLNKINPYSYNLTSMGGQFEFNYNNKDFLVEVNIKKVPLDMIHRFQFPPVVNSDEKTLYNVEYTVNGHDLQFEKTDYSTLIKILKTISEIVHKQIAKLENPLLTFFSVDRKGSATEDKQKNNLYRITLGKNLPSGWRLGVGLIDGYLNFIFITKDGK